MPDLNVQFSVVNLILNKKTEEALSLLSSFYKIATPEIRVGTVKGKRKTVYAVYVPRERRIYASTSDIYYNPFIVLHEYYHHLRSQGTVHRGSEDHANKYAKEFLLSYAQTLRTNTIYSPRSLLKQKVE
ncbi:MAG: hypothetical protein ACM3JQ_00705 [Candidatus Eiseniibacteriota bacterium]